MRSSVMVMVNAMVGMAWHGMARQGRTGAREGDRTRSPRYMFFRETQTVPRVRGRIRCTHIHTLTLEIRLRGQGSRRLSASVARDADKILPRRCDHVYASAVTFRRSPVHTLPISIRPLHPVQPSTSTPPPATVRRPPPLPEPSPPAYI